ncbi:MAG: hypothetical protein KKF77_10925 [Proteobacteria bacterium]|nr:hypothetical protein [Pseudomonadota bacterium]
MTWIGDLSLDPEDQTLVNLAQVSFITSEQAGAGRVVVTLTMGAGQTVRLNMARERYSDLVRKLEVIDVS